MFLIRVNLNKDVYKNYMYAVLWILYVVIKTTTYAMYRYLFICCAIFQLAFLTWYRCSPLSSLCCVAHNMVPLGIACWMNEKTHKKIKPKHTVIKIYFEDRKLIKTWSLTYMYCVTRTGLALQLHSRLTTVMQLWKNYPIWWSILASGHSKLLEVFVL